MKKIILTIAVALATLTFTSCEKEVINPTTTINHSVLNDAFEGEWTINKTYYYDSLGEYVVSNVTGTILIEDSMYAIDTDFYTQAEHYSIESNSTSSVVYMNIPFYGTGSGEGTYSMKNNTTTNSLILIVPTEPGASNNAYKLIKASR